MTACVHVKIIALEFIEISFLKNILLLYVPLPLVDQHWQLDTSVCVK